MMKAARLLVLILGLPLPPLGHAQAPLQKVVVTYSSRSIASIDLFIAQERGFFREEGLVPPARVFDFTLQREVNRELGGK